MYGVINVSTLLLPLGGDTNQREAVADQNIQSNSLKQSQTE